LVDSFNNFHVQKLAKKLNADHLKFGCAFANLALFLAFHRVCLSSVHLLVGRLAMKQNAQFTDGG